MINPNLKSAVMGRLKLLGKLHIAKKELCLDDDTYRDVLRNLFKVESARDLNDYQIGQAIRHFQRLGWKPKASRQKAEGGGQKAEGGRQKKYDDQKGDVYSATPPQKRMIEAMWHDIYRGNDEAKHLRQFLFRVAKVDDLRFLEKKNASDVVEAIKAMRKRKFGVRSSEFGE